jgi:8-oxo-dGTP pyrophosphatase MutT (NUDIX family)
LAGARDRSPRSSGKSTWLRQFSAGGVVVRRDNGRIFFLAIKPVERDRWQLPKGTIDRGESAEKAAVREVREEGGVDASIVADLGEIRYFYRMAGRAYAKTVRFYLMSYQAGDPADHDQEVQEAAWFPLDEADRLTFKSEQELVEKARGMLVSR